VREVIKPGDGKTFPKKVSLGNDFYGLGRSSDHGKFLFGLTMNSIVIVIR
jgi:hypothetical protein